MSNDTESRIKEIRERVKNASPGPWSVGRGAWHRITVDAPNEHYPVVAGVLEENADFIAAARSDVPWLLEQFEEAQRQLVKYRNDLYGQVLA